jgi:hypothetical protein
MAFMQACLMIENGERVTPAVLLTGFRKPVLAALCKIGLVYLAVSLVLMCWRAAIDAELLASRSAAGSAPGTSRRCTSSDMLRMFGCFLLNRAC